MIKKMSNDWEREFTNELRERKVLSMLPFIIVSGETSDFHYTGKWFEYVTIQEQKVKDRYMEFDDGWSYQHYWGSWKTGWILTKLIK